jgi:hypothetical protein
MPPITFVDSLDTTGFPQILLDYLGMTPEQKRAWIATDATPAQWDEFFAAVFALPEPQRTVMWGALIHGPFPSEVNARHPQFGRPRGQA